MPPFIDVRSDREFKEIIRTAINLQHSRGTIGSNQSIEELTREIVIRTQMYLDEKCSDYVQERTKIHQDLADTKDMMYAWWATRLDSALESWRRTKEKQFPNLQELREGNSLQFTIHCVINDWVKTIPEIADTLTTGNIGNLISSMLYNVSEYMKLKVFDRKNPSE